MVRSVPRPTFSPARTALILLLSGSALAGCGDSMPFSRNNTASNATKLSVPSTLTPPVQVGRISGAPTGWKMGEKVAEALRQRDIPAGTAKQGDSALVLRGEVRETHRNTKSSQVSVLWRLFDAKGKKVGEVTQVAAVPKGVMVTPNDDVVEAIADAAAESISPIVPSTRIDVADNVTTGEPEDKAATRAAKPKVTALGKQKDTNSGISRNFTARANDKNKKTDDAKIDLPRPLASNTTDGKRRVSAIGRIDDGPSALSQNLAKGLNPAAGEDAKKPKVDLRPPELADPARHEPKVAFRQRTKPAKLHRDTKQIADAPDAKPAAKPSLPRPVVTEFYPASPKARRAATSVRERNRPATVVAIPPKRSSKPTTVAKHALKPVAPKPAAPKQVARTSEPIPRTSNKYVFWVQVGSYRTPELSAAKWTQTRDRAPKLLNTVDHRIDRAKVGSRGIWHRIQVGPYTSKSVAAQKCRQLKSARIDCFILPERTGPAATPVSAAPARRPTNIAATPYAPKAAPRVTVVTNDSVRPTERKRYPVSTSPGLPGLIP